MERNGLVNVTAVSHQNAGRFLSTRWPYSYIASPTRKVAPSFVGVCASMLLERCKEIDTSLVQPCRDSFKRFGPADLKPEVRNSFSSYYPPKQTLRRIWHTVTLLWISVFSHI